MCRAQAEVHDLLHRQYGLLCAGQFMPHMTIKGFFQTEAPHSEMAAKLDAAMQGHQPFPVINNGVVVLGSSIIALDVQHLGNGERNAQLDTLHQSILKEFLPLVSVDCDFTPKEALGDQFAAHLTLAMADIPEVLFDEVADFIRSAEPIGPRRYEVDVCTLYSFESDDWTGRWWETLRWRLLYSRQLS